MWLTLVGFENGRQGLEGVPLACSRELVTPVAASRSFRWGRSRSNEMSDSCVTDPKLTLRVGCLRGGKYFQLVVPPPPTPPADTSWVTTDNIRDGDRGAQTARGYRVTENGGP
jgi:hypothetical protein